MNPSRVSDLSRRNPHSSGTRNGASGKECDTTDIFVMASAFRPQRLHRLPNERIGTVLFHVSGEQFGAGEISTGGFFSTVIHNFAQIFSANSIDGAKRWDYFARRLNRSF